jgi:DNA-directed RNA polymerase subunit delta
MKRVIVDYSKLTHEILNLLVERFPDGYDDADIIRFKNAKNETIEAVEVKTSDTIYLVKVSTKLHDRIENYDEDEEIELESDPIETLKELEIDDDENDEEETEKLDSVENLDPEDDDEDENLNSEEDYDDEEDEL